CTPVPHDGPPNPTGVHLPGYTGGCTPVPHDGPPNPTGVHLPGYTGGCTPVPRPHRSRCGGGGGAAAAVRQRRWWRCRRAPVIRLRPAASKVAPAVAVS